MGPVTSRRPFSYTARMMKKKHKTFKKLTKTRMRTKNYTT